MCYNCIFTQENYIQVKKSGAHLNFILILMFKKHNVYLLILFFDCRFARNMPQTNFMICILFIDKGGL